MPSKPSARPRRPTRAAIRVALLTAAEQVFAEHGFESASVELIAERADYSTGAIYSNFKGKEDLFLTLFEERMAARTAAIERATSGVGLEAGIERGAGDFMSFLAEDRDWFLLLFEFRAYAARHPEFGRRFRERHRAAQEALATLVEANARRLGIDLGLPPDEAATVLKALANGLALEALADPEAVPADLYARTVALLVSGAQGGAAAGA